MLYWHKAQETLEKIQILTGTFGWRHPYNEATDWRG
jgi:hypothetical protein